MKRFHLHVGVKDLEKSVLFYSTLFGLKPTKLKEDYAKWVLEDPKLNFAISTRVQTEGVDHLGIQVESENELEEITTRLKNTDLGIYDEGTTTCCYSESNKAWVQDPSGIAWETYQNMGDAEIFSKASDASLDDDSNCCIPDDAESSCC